MLISELKRGDVVQLSPVKVENRVFSGCMMTVTEPESWGAVGYIQALGEGGQPGGLAYYRAGWEEMELVGQAIWVAEGC